MPARRPAVVTGASTAIVKSESSHHLATDIVRSETRSSPRFESRRRINVRVLLSLLGTCVVVGGLVHLLHGFQLDSNADALKDLLAG